MSTPPSHGEGIPSGEIFYLFKLMLLFGIQLTNSIVDTVIPYTVTHYVELSNLVR